MSNKLNEYSDKISFGSGGINYGTEYRQSFAVNHSMTLAAIRQKFFPTPYQDAVAKVSVEVSFAGKFNPNLETSVGKARINSRNREIEVPISIALAEFAPGREREFRDTFAGLLDTAVERIAAHKDCGRIGIDPVWLKSQWQKARDEYLALSLPLPPFVSPADSKPVEPGNAEYFFLFEKKNDIKQFEKALEARGLMLDWDDESGEDGYYGTVTDPDSRHRNEAFEKELVALAEQFGGEYDGWAAV